MIDVQNLWYTFAGAEQPALQGLDFQIQDGELASVSRHRRGHASGRNRGSQSEVYPAR